MPVYVVSAGNNGDTHQMAQPRVADLARNSLVVGEANNGNGQQTYIEDHSSRINPTLASDNPFNRGAKYQYYNVSPSLEGHEDLIREWIIQREVLIGFNLVKDFNKNTNLDNEYWGKALVDIFDAKYKNYTETQEGKAWLQEKIDGYMANPKTLHKLVMEQIRESHDVDENGFTSDIDGTSFSGPEQAGYVSGTLYEQEKREANNLPILTKDEITTLVKMATIDTVIREGEDDPMYAYTNDDGNEFVFGAGHGVFQPDIYRDLLNKAYKIIETNPDISRDSVTRVMNADVPENHIGSTPITMKSDTPEDNIMVIDRMRIDVIYTVDARFPHFVNVSGIDEDDVNIRLQTANVKDTNGYLSWSRVERQFGEELPNDKTLDIRLAYGETSTLNAARITVYGYNKGGLMDQMMDYSKELTAEVSTPEPDTKPAAVMDSNNLMF